MVPCQARYDVWALSLSKRNDPDYTLKGAVSSTEWRLSKNRQNFWGDAQEFLGLGIKIAPLGAALRH